MIGVAGTGNLVERVISAATQAVVVPLVPTALIVPKATVAIAVLVVVAVIRMTKITMKRRSGRNVHGIKVVFSLMNGRFDGLL